MKKYILKNNYTSSSISINPPFNNVYSEFKKGCIVEGEISEDGLFLSTFSDGTFDRNICGRNYFKIPLTELTAINDDVSNNNSIKNTSRKTSRFYLIFILLAIYVLYQFYRKSVN